MPTGDHSASGETGEEQRESVGPHPRPITLECDFCLLLKPYRTLIHHGTNKECFIPSVGAEIQHLQSEISRLENPTNPIEVTDLSCS